MFSCDIENKSVISPDTMSVIGSAVGVTLNRSNKKVKSLIVKRVKSKSEDIFLDVKKIIGVNDYITAKQKDISKNRNDNYPKCSFNTPIIDIFGKIIAFVKDIIFDEVGNIVEIREAGVDIDGIKILGISSKFIVITDAEIAKKSQKTSKISIPSIDINDKLGNYRYILNKVVTKTIVDSYMTPIILRNTLVTEKVIELAIANGKIIELIVNTN